MFAEQLFGGRPRDAGFQDGLAGYLVEAEEPVEPAQVQRDDRGEFTAVGVQPADDTGSAPERYDGDPALGGEGDLVATAERGAVDGGHDRLGEGLDPAHQAQVRALALRLAAWTRLDDRQIEEILAELDRRMTNTPEDELAEVGDQLIEIAVLRLEGILA